MLLPHQSPLPLLSLPLSHSTTAPPLCSRSFIHIVPPGVFSRVTHSRRVDSRVQREGVAPGHRSRAGSKLMQGTRRQRRAKHNASSLPTTDVRTQSPGRQRIAEQTCVALLAASDAGLTLLLRASRLTVEFASAGPELP